MASHQVLAPTVDYDGKSITIENKDASSTTWTLRLTSRTRLTAWDTLLSHDTSDRLAKKESKFDGNPFTPKELRVLSTLPSRFLGRAWGHSQVFGSSALYRVQKVATTRHCRRNSASARSSKSAPPRTVRRSIESSMVVVAHVVESQTEGPDAKSSPPTCRLRTSRLPSMVSFVSKSLQQVSRSVNNELLSESTLEARSKMRQLISEHKILASSNGLGMRRGMLDLGMSRSSSILSSSRTMPLGSVTALLSRSSATPSPRSVSIVPRASTTAPLGSGQDTAACSAQGATRCKHDQQHKWPVVEVYFEGEDAPVLTLRNAVHPLDSVASLRSTIDKEFRDMVGGASLADETNWTFSSFHPPAVVWLSKLLHDFKTFYSDTEHSRYTGSLAKEMKLRVARHREQADNLQKYLQILRLSLESCASVEQLCPRIQMNIDVYKKHCGLPHEGFFNGSVRPQLPPKGPPPSVSEVRCFLTPVMGAIRAQIERMSTKAANPNTSIPPPPLECGIPMFTGSATRVGNRLVNMARRRSALRRYGEDLESGALEKGNIRDGSIELAIPRITLKKIDPTFSWDRADVLMTQIEEICRDGRGAALEEVDPLQMDTNAGEDESMGILLGGVDKGIRSPPRSRSPISPSGSEAGGMRSRSPTQRLGTSPTQSSNGASSSFVVPVLSAEEELQRILEQGIAPLYRCDAIGWSYVDYAVWFRRPSIVSLLCQFGANPSNQDRTNGDTVLHRFIKLRTRTVKDLQSFKAILDQCSPRHLLSVLQTRNFQGLTPLSLATQLRDFVVVQAILATANSPRCRHIMSAARYPSGDEETVMCATFTFDNFIDECSLPHLLWVEDNCFADPANAVGEVLGASLLHRAMMAPSFSIMSPEARDHVIATMLTRVDPLTKDIYERTAFHCAARSSGCTKWLVPFLDHMHARAGSILMASSPVSFYGGGSTTTTGGHRGLGGRNQSNHPGMMAGTGKMIGQCADSDGNTVLHTALMWCKDQSALDVDVYAFVAHQYVLPHVQLDQQNRAGDTVLHLVMQRKQLQLAELLCRSLKYESAGFLQRLFTLRNADGDTILGCAINSQFAAGIRRLLEVESIAEVSLHARGSFDRLPLLLAVDVVGAKQSVGTEFASMDQRPHCVAREEADCLYILLKIAQDHRLLHDIMHMTSGPRNETALHGAARHLLWHPCAMLMSFGASPNKLDGEGRTALAISFLHPHDTSLPRLMIANDTSEWHTGETLLACLSARGAASCSSAFMDDCFFNRYPYPWSSDAAFAAPILDVASKSGNLYVMERLLCLGVRPLPGRGNELFALLLDKYQEASDYCERGSRWKRMEHLYVHVTSPVRPRELHDVVEGLLLTMSEDHTLLSEVRYSFLTQAVRADFCRLAASLLRRLQRDDEVCNAGDCNVMVTPRPRRSARCAAAELLRNSRCHAWVPNVRRDVLSFDAERLLSSENDNDQQLWLQAVSLATSSCDLEALIILTSTGVPCKHSGHVQLPRVPFVPVQLSQSPARLECLWLARRCTLPLPMLLTLMLIEDQLSAVEALLATLPHTRIIELLLDPVVIDVRWITSLGRSRVLRWATKEAAACPLAIAASSLVVTESLRVLMHHVCSIEMIDSSRSEGLVIEALRDAIMTAIDCGAWSCVEFFVKECVLLHFSRDIQTSIFAAIRMDSLSIFDGTTLEHLVACPHPLSVDVLVWLIPAILSPSQCEFSSETTTKLFHAIQQTTQGHRDQQRIRDTLLVFLMGGIEHVALPQRVTANRPNRQQSVTALEQLHMDAISDTKGCGELVRALQQISLTISTSSLCSNRLAATLTVDHLHTMVQCGLVLSLAHVHCVAPNNNTTFACLEGALSQTECGGYASHMKYLSAMLLRDEVRSSSSSNNMNSHTTHNVVPDVVVNAVIDASRAEVSEWRLHTQWWVDHVLDIYHPANVRRVPVQTRRTFPILSMMRDVARSEPSTTRGAVPSMHGSVIAATFRPPYRHHGASPLHCAVFANREAAVVQMLQEGSRELDVNVLDASGRTSLVWAAKLGRHGIASQLVSTGVDILIEDRYGLNSLAYAADANMVELILADDDGEDAANSRSSKPHRSSPLMYHLRCGRGLSAMALLNSVVCENCVLETMIDGVTGETLVHLAAARRELHANVLPALLDGRLPLTYVLQADVNGWTARDYCAPRSSADLLLEEKGVPRTMRLWPEGKYSIGLRDYRSIRHNITHLITGTSSSSSGGGEDAVWKEVLNFHVRTNTESIMTIDEMSWELASRGEDKELLVLLERGHRDMQVVRLYGIPAPRNEKDKRSVAKDVNLLLQMRFGGCRGGCRLVFPSEGHDDATEPHPYLTVASDNISGASATLPKIIPASHLPEGIDPNAPYAAALMIDDTRIPQLMAANSGLSVKNRPLRVIREPSRGPQYRTVIQPHTSTLLHQLCKTGCLRSLSYVLRNNASQGSPNELICRLLSATYDENGLTPFHIAVIYRQWPIVLELLRNRIPLGPVHQKPTIQHVGTPEGNAPLTFSVGPQQIFASLVQLMSFQWFAGTGNTPSNSAPLVDTIPNKRGSTASLLSSSRFSAFDAEVAAYALMRTAATDIMILGRMQRIVLTSILDTSTAAACAALVTSLADRCDTAFKPFSVLGSHHAHSRDQYILRKLLDHYRNGVMQIDVDHEGADARDSANERERTKALLMYHIQGGALFRVLESAILDTFMLAEDLGDGAHPSLRVYRWVSLLHIDQVRFVCCKSKTDIPTATMAPSSFNRGCFGVRLTFFVDPSGQLRCPDLTAVLRDFFFTALLDAAWSLCTTVALHGVHVSILDEETLLTRRFVTAVRARRYLEEQQSTPAPSHLSVTDGGEDDNEEITEPVDAAVVCWQHLKRHFEEHSGPAGDADNRSIASSSMSNQSCAVASAQVERLSRFILDVCTLLVRDAIPNTIQQGNNGHPRHVLLPGGRRVTLQQDCEVTLVLHRLSGRANGDSLAIQEVHQQEDARVAPFDGLALLQRDWQGSAASSNEPASPGLKLLTNKASAAALVAQQQTTGGEGLALLARARQVVKGEHHVLVVCPIHESIDDIEAGSTLVGVPFAACSMYRGSQWKGNHVSRYVWKSTLWSTLLATSRPSTRPTTATRPPLGGGGRLPTSCGSLVVSPFPLAIDGGDVQRPQSALSLTDISAHIDLPATATSDTHHSVVEDPMLEIPSKVRPFVPPQSISALADMLDEQGARVALCFEQLAAAAAVKPQVQSTSASNKKICRFSTIVELVVPFLLDPFFVWTSLRAVNKQTCEAVVSLACTRALLPVHSITLRLREKASSIDSVRAQWCENFMSLPSTSRLPTSQALCTSYLHIAAKEDIDEHDEKLVPPSSGAVGIEDAQFAAFLLSPMAMFHHVASVRGIFEASRLPQCEVQRGKRLRRHSSRSTPPAAQAKPLLQQQGSLRLIETTFALLYPSVVTLWKCHRFLELWERSHEKGTASK